MFEINEDNNTMSITRGDTAYITVNLANSDGTTYIMNANDKLTITVKSSASDTTPAFQIVNTGTNIFHIVPNNTKELDVGTYVYDIQLDTSTDDVYTVVGKSKFKILEEVT